MKNNLPESPTAHLRLEDNIIKLSGTLCFVTVPRIRVAGNLLITERAKTTVDFQEVTRCDSSVLSLLTVWTALAKERGKQINFANLPPQLLEIAKLSRLDKLLPITN